MTPAKHYWIIPLVTAVVVGVVGWWANLEVRRGVEREVKSNLETTLAANVESLTIWLNTQKRIASGLAAEPRLRTLANEFLDRSEPTDTNRLSQLEKSRMIAAESLPQRLQTLGYSVAEIVGTNYAIVARTGGGGGRGRTNAVPEELQPRFKELFSTGEPIVVTPFRPPPTFGPGGRGGGGGRGGRGGPPGRGQGGPQRLPTIVMQVAAPIKDDSLVTHGALALNIDPDAEFTRILSVARSGESGETIAFDPEGILISKSRFDDELRKLGLIGSNTNVSSALALHLLDPGGDMTQGFRIADTNAARPLIELVERAIAGDSGVELNPFRDYRGVPVIGAWQWLPAYDFGVVTKLDAYEAFHELRLVRGVFVVLFLLLVFASLVIFLFSYRQFVWHQRATAAELKARQLGQYKLEEQIGEGGMGVVYKAHHALLRRDTALKLLPPDKANPDTIRRFEREVRLTCRLTHPNTIQVYDYGHTPDGIFYYAMEYLDGLNLGQLVERYGALPEQRVIHLLRQVCESLSEAHGLGLIHRDLKPANIFVCDRGGVPDCVKVLDFGLVRRFGDVHDTKTQTGAVLGEIVGTPHFIAPESLKDPAVNDVRSDIYSLGSLGYFLLTGQHVFDGTSVVQICQRHLTDTPEPPSAKAVQPISPQLDALILRCLEKDPAARPQSADELATGLAACMRAGEWTLEQRAAWWSAHRKAVVAAPASARPHLPSSQDTVRIALAERTL